MLSNQKVSVRRRKLGKVALGFVGCAWLKILPPEAQPLNQEGQKQMSDLLYQLNQMVPLAQQTLDMMDPGVFVQAPDSLHTTAQIKELIGQMPKGYEHLLSVGNIRTLPIDYMLETDTVAMAQGGLTPWESDNVVVISWDERRQEIAINSGESFLEALSHEYTHFFYGLHNFSFQREMSALINKSGSEKDFVELAKKYGDVSYMVGDIFWMLDDWSSGVTDEFGKPLHLEMAQAYGLDESEVATIAVRSIEIRKEWEKRVELSELSWIDNTREKLMR